MITIGYKIIENRRHTKTEDEISISIVYLKGLWECA